MKCCGDHVEAAKASHLECLARLQEDGHFFGLNASERETGGEARKAQVWDAATAACEAGHAHVLEWLFADGWPTRIDAEPSWQMYEHAPPQNVADLDLLCTKWVRGYTPLKTLPDFQLYCAATATPDTACIKVLLNAGCRSDWLCPLAAREGRVAHLILAAKRGCLCDERTLHEAARKGHLLALQAADRCYATITEHDEEPAWYRRYVLIEAAESGARAGHGDCLLYLLDTHQEMSSDMYHLSEILAAAAKGGHLPVLKMLHERGRPWGEDLRSSLEAASNPECLHYLLDHMPEEALPDFFMINSLARLLKEPHGAATIQILYDRGFLPRSGQLWGMLTRRYRNFCISPNIRWPCLDVLLANSGPPPQHLLRTAPCDVGGDPATLRYVLELGAPWDERTLWSDDGCVPLEFLRYAHENGCPWGDVKLSDFLYNFDGCYFFGMRYAHVNGCPYDSNLTSGVRVPLDDFPLIRYICEQMDPTWADQLLANSLQDFSRQRVRRRRQRCRQALRRRGLSSEDFDVEECMRTHVNHISSTYVDWRVPLYLLRRIGRARVGVLADMADVRLGRAAALAQCFYGAEKSVREAGRAGGCHLGLHGAMPRRAPAPHCQRGPPRAPPPAPNRRQR